MNSEIVLGFVIGAIGAPFLIVVPLLWYYRKKDTDIITLASDTVYSCEEVQTKCLQFFQDNEKALIKLFYRSIELLRKTDHFFDAESLDKDLGDWIAKRNLGALEMTSAFSDVAEKMASYKKLVLGDAEKMRSDQINDPKQVREQPIYRLVVNTLDPRLNEESDKIP